MAKRCFEFVDGKSNKFWDIEVDGDAFTVTWGRRGTAGQSQTKSFASTEAATVEADKLVAKKLKGGYTEIASTPQAAPSSPKKAKPATPVEKAEPISKPSAPTLHRTEVSARGVCSIDLDPDDWAWATWREQPEPAPQQPEPFDLEDRIARLARFKMSRYASDWSDVGIPRVMTAEEAEFWYSLMVLVSKGTAANSLAAGARSMKRQAITLARVKKDLARASSRGAPDEMWIPLANTLAATDLAVLIESELRSNVAGFRRFALPLLSAQDKEALRSALRPSISVKNWPKDYYEVPAMFHVAAALGMSNELLPIVEAMEADFYGLSGWDHTHYHRPQEVIMGLSSAALVEQHMRRLRLKLLHPEFVRGWLAHTECGALDVVTDTILSVKNRVEAASLAQELARVRAPEAAEPMVMLFRHSKAPEVAKAWLEENAAVAITGLVAAFEKGGKVGDAATGYLQTLVARGYGEAIAGAAGGLGAAARDRLRDKVLESRGASATSFSAETTPAWLVQGLGAARKRKLPAWLELEVLPPLLIGDNRLDREQVTALMAILSEASPDRKPDVCKSLAAKADRKSLDAFVWALFEQWLSAGAPSKEKWAFLALGHLGGDETALRLAPMIRAWPGESQHARAVLGLDVLRTIGTSTALMQLSGIAQKLKFKALKERANQAMEAIAADMGLTKAELEDRVVPDCGLDDRGTRVFDFGPRQFSFVMGPGMKPMLRDGKRAIGDLPKPGVKDDAAKAGEAVAEWKLMKKQVREVTNIQVPRLEQAMVTGRTWTPGDFDALIARHPLMTHVARPMVWGGFDGKGKLVRTFRITDELDLADVEDRETSLEGIARVALVHPLQLSEKERQAWGTVLADYEIIQPFPQLGRPVHQIEESDSQKEGLERFHKLKIPAPSLVFTLEKLGWARGCPMDGGCFDEHSKPYFAAGVTAVVSYEGVAAMQYIDPSELLTVRKCYFVRGIRGPSGYEGNEACMKLASVDPIVLSETIHDLARIAEKAK